MGELKVAAGGAGDGGADAFRTSGTSPTNERAGARIHLLGPGNVGRALLERLGRSHHTLVAVTDGSATVHDAAGLSCRSIIRWKESGLPLREHPRARVLSAAAALAESQADVVVDASATDLDRAGWTEALDGALRGGASLAFAAKAALCDAAGEWLSGDNITQVGCNAVLGGTGSQFRRGLHELRAGWCGAAIVGNASTTAIITALEHGATLADGIADAARLGYLESDPTLDLRGTDAAIKLAIVAGALTSRRIDPRAIPCDDIREIDIALVRQRVRRGATTRLVGRLWPDGAVRVAYEEVPADSLLAAPCGRVVYEYRLKRDERRLHIGTGLGADATAEALWQDVRELAAGVPLAYAGDRQ